MATAYLDFTSSLNGGHARLVGRLIIILFACNTVATVLGWSPVFRRGLLASLTNIWQVRTERILQRRSWKFPSYDIWRLEGVSFRTLCFTISQKSEGNGKISKALGGVVNIYFRISGYRPLTHRWSVISGGNQSNMLSRSCVVFNMTCNALHHAPQLALRKAQMGRHLWDWKKM